MSSDEQSDKECPLCMEAFEDDINFFPCSCQYQICRFCWHRLRTDENGLCPACRQPYPEDPVNFQPLSTAEVQKIKIDKRQKQLQQKNKLSECRKHLSAYRVLQKNLVYVIGLSQRMADAELLKKPDFFGKFGKILKIAVGAANNININNTQPPSFTAYVTYVKTDDALRAIQAVNNLVVDGRLIKASLGTTKYCSNFLKGQNCHKQECMYLHDVADNDLSFTKDDMHQGRHTEMERKLHEQMNAQSQQQLAPTSQQPPIPVSNGCSNGSKNGRSRTDSHSEFEKPPPGFSKLGSIGLVEKSSFEVQESSSKNDNAWNERNVRTPTPPTTRQLFCSNDQSASIPVNFFGHDSSCNGSGSFARSYSETDAALNESRKYDTALSQNNTALSQNSSFPSDSKPMTCDELERILLNNSVPPGFKKQDSVHSFVSTADYRQNSTQNPRETPVLQTPPCYSSAPPDFSTTCNSKFFLDLYDDLGFDPFSESSKALADMLEEEKTANN